MSCVSTSSTIASSGIGEARRVESALAQALAESVDVRRALHVHDRRHHRDLVEIWASEAVGPRILSPEGGSCPVHGQR